MVATLRAADSFQKRRLLGAILAVRRTGRASATSVDLLTEPPQLVAERLRPINLALGYLDRRFKPCQQDVEYRLSAGVEHPAHGDLFGVGHRGVESGPGGGHCQHGLRHRHYLLGRVLRPTEQHFTGRNPGASRGCHRNAQHA
jgi:hypothetical protein